MRVRLNISYDGTDFCGWQIQPSGRTLQGELELALGKFYGGKAVRTLASGRTDAGVHAVMQVVHYDAPVNRDSETIVKGLNALLPDDMQVWQARYVDDEFHARFSARGRLYAYRILKTNDLFLHRFGWSAGNGFDLNRARTASSTFIGKHDFRAYSTQPDLDESTVCNVRRIDWREDEYGWIMEIEADRFIRRLVRTLAGSIVAMVKGTVNSEELQNALEKGEGRVPPPAPPQGLALVQVRYNDETQHDAPPGSLWGTFPLA